MGILKNRKANTLVVSIIMMAILLYCSSQVQAGGGTGESDYLDCTGLTSITIPPGAKIMNEYYFRGCTDLTSITIPSSVTIICSVAFSNCTVLTNISVDANNPSYLSEGGILYNKTKTTVEACPIGLTNVNIPEGVTSIGISAFENYSGSTSIDIPSSVTSICENAFYGCSLTSITFNSASTTIYDNQYTIQEATKIIGYDPSTAKAYAAKYNREFEVVNSTVTPDTTGMTEWTATSSTTVKPDKFWTITLNGIVNEDSVTNKVYVTDLYDNIQSTTCTFPKNNGCSQIIVSPTNGYASGEYYLMVKDLESAEGTKIKNQVYLKFTVE